MTDQPAIAPINDVPRKIKQATANGQESRCFIVLLVESKLTVETEIKNFLRHLNIPFTIDSPYISVPVVQENCDIDIFRYVKNLTRLLLTKFKKFLRVCVQAVYFSSSDQHSFTIDKVRDLIDLVIQTMRETLDLTSWESISACSRIASSGICTPLGPVTTLTMAETGWSYISVSEPFIEFVGRPWELSQLSSCFRSVIQSRHGLTVYIDGMEGIGKSALVHRFAESINSQSSDVVLLDLCYLRVSKQSALQYLIRRLLNLPAPTSDAIVRSKIASSNISVALQVFICLMAGVALQNTETRLLNAMEAGHRQAASSEALAELIDQRTADNPLVLVIEDIYLADAGFTEVIKELARLVHSTPLLLCITTRKIGQYSHRPAWLEHACTMELAAFTRSQSTTIANTVKSATTEYIAECVRQAGGNPGYLLQMLYGKGCSRNFSEALYATVTFTLNRLSANDVMALKIAAIFGKPLSLAQWRGLVIPMLGNPNVIHTPQALVYVGLFKHCADSFTFQHPAIRDVILDIITREEHAQIEKAIQQWNMKWGLEQESAMSSPWHTEGFQALKNQAFRYRNFFQYKRSPKIHQDTTTAVSLDSGAYLFNHSSRVLLSQDKITERAAFHQHVLDVKPHHTDIDVHRIDLAKVYDLMGKREKVIEITEHISEALPRPAVDSSWSIWAEVHAIRGSCRLYSGCLEEARIDYKQAVYCSRQISDPKTRVMALAGKAKCSYAQGRMQEAFEDYSECIKLCKESGLLSMEAEIRAMLARVHLFQLESAEAMESGRQAVMLAHHTGNARAELIARLSLSWVLLDVNAWQQARKEVVEGLKLAYRAKAFRYLAFLLESKARLLWNTGAGHKATIAINRALKIIKAQSLEEFTGSWFSATKALVTKSRDDRYQALAQGEAWLQTSVIAQNILNFYSQGINTAWQLGDTSLLKKYQSQLHRYNSDTPTRRAKIYLSQVDLMLNIINGSASPSSLQDFNKRAAECDMFRLQLDVSVL